MKLYEGKEPCIGCGRSGEVAPRERKDALCKDCSEALWIGRGVVRDLNLDRSYYRLPEFQQYYMTWYVIPINTVDKALRKLLSTFCQFDKRNISGTITKKTILCGIADAVTSHDTFLLPTITGDAANELCQALRDVCWQLKREKDEYKKTLEKEVADQKNEIYNLGVEHGRNLLFQLNNGEISIDDFSKHVKKY